MAKFDHIKMNGHIEHKLIDFLDEQIQEKHQPYSRASDLKKRIDDAMAKLIKKALPESDLKILSKHNCLRNCDYVWYHDGPPKDGGQTARATKWKMSCRRPEQFAISNLSKRAVFYLIAEYNTLMQSFQKEVGDLQRPYLHLIWYSPSLQHVVDAWPACEAIANEIAKSPKKYHFTGKKKFYELSEAVVCAEKEDV